MTDKIDDDLMEKAETPLDIAIRIVNQCGSKIDTQAHINFRHMIEWELGHYGYRMKLKGGQDERALSDRLMDALGEIMTWDTGSQCICNHEACIFCFAKEALEEVSRARGKNDKPML